MTRLRYFRTMYNSRPMLDLFLDFFLCPHTNFCFHFFSGRMQIIELKKRLETTRQQIRQLPGIEFNKEEQLQRLQSLRNQLKLKQDLIRKYKNTEF